MLIFIDEETVTIQELQNDRQEEEHDERRKNIGRI